MAKASQLRAWVFITLAFLISGCASKAHFTPLPPSSVKPQVEQRLPNTFDIKATGKGFWSSESEKVNFDFTLVCKVELCRLLASHALGPVVAEVALSKKGNFMYLPLQDTTSRLHFFEMDELTPMKLRDALWLGDWKLYGWTVTQTGNDKTWKKIKLVNASKEKLILLIQSLELGKIENLNFSSSLQSKL
ncbi:MAG: hypothetical protein QNL04_13300 [SAR324 cluster bacterium]|nr:hypothetical protein [SAR324 cluster bacterium]